MRRNNLVKKRYVLFIVAVLTLVFTLPVQALPKAPRPVEALPFVFTPGTRGTLLADGLPIAGNITLLANHLHDINYVLNSVEIPKVQADTDWLFRGWRVQMQKANEGQFAHLFQEAKKLEAVQNPSEISGSFNAPQENSASPQPVKEDENISADVTGQVDVTAEEETKEAQTIEEIIAEVEIITRQNMNEALAKYLDIPNPDIVYSSDVLQFLKLPYRKGYIYRASPYYQYIPKTPQSLLIRHQLDAQTHVGHLAPMPATGEQNKRLPGILLIILSLGGGVLFYAFLFQSRVKLRY